jgi:hypothetical protein
MTTSQAAPSSAGRRKPTAPIVDQRLHDLGSHVAHAHAKAGTQERFRDPAAYRTQPDHANPGFVHERTLFRDVDVAATPIMVQWIAQLVHLEWIHVS